MGRYCGGEPTIHREFQRAVMEEMGREDWDDPDDCGEEDEEPSEPVAETMGACL